MTIPENGYRVVLYNLLADLYLNLALPQVWKS